MDTTHTLQRRVIFILDRLAGPGNLNRGTAAPNAPLRAEDVAAAPFYMSLVPIVNCSLRTSGICQSVFVNFEPGRLFLVDLTKGVPSLTQAEFQHVLAAMFSTGVAVNADTQQEYCRRIDDGFNGLPANSRIIALVSGNMTGSNMIPFGDWISALPDSGQPLVFVVGRRLGLEIEARISATLKISEYPLNDSACVNALILSLENKWGI